MLRGTRDDADRGVRSRRAIYEAFFAELARVGYAKLTVGAVVRRAGVSKGRFYHHFRDKNDLVEKAMRARAGDFVSHLTAALRDGISLERAVAGLLETLRPSPVGKHGVLELFTLAITDEGLREAVRADYSVILSGGTVLLEEAKAQGMLAADVDVEYLASRLYTGAFGLVLVKAALGERNSIPEALQRFFAEELSRVAPQGRQPDSDSG